MDGIQNALPSHLTEFNQGEKKAKNTMGKDDFMNLLMTQLRYQDPLNPMDHKEMSTNLAQFSSLETLTHIDKGIQNLRSGIEDETKMQAVAMIGRNVHASANEIDLVEGNEVSLQYDVKSEYKPSKISIYSNEGKLIREMDVQRADQGKELRWDGKDQDGNRLPSGKYTCRLVGLGANGQTQELGTELSGKVTGVEMDGSDAVLLVKTSTGTTKLPLSKVRNVSDDSANIKESSSPDPKATPSPTAGETSASGRISLEKPISFNLDPRGMGDLMRVTETE